MKPKKENFKMERVPEIFSGSLMSGQKLTEKCPLCLVTWIPEGFCHCFSWGDGAEVRIGGCGMRTEKWRQRGLKSRHVLRSVKAPDKGWSQACPVLQKNQFYKMKRLLKVDGCTTV